VNPGILFDPLFAAPLAVGLGLSLLLPVLGALLRLRDEWLAAMGLAHLAGASGLIGMAVGLPVVLGASLGALIGAAAKNSGRLTGNTVYALMILIGWCVTLLVAANTPLGAVMGHALIDGQLYLAGSGYLAAVAALLVLALLALPYLIPHVVRARLQPSFEAANRLPSWRWHLGFDLLAALGIAVGAAAVGVMAAFALAFVPPWVAFRIADNWRQCLLISVAVALLAYLLAFAAALLIDQPFGPVLVAVLLLSAFTLKLAKR
jgi:zinc transport system permease protein